MLTVAPLPPKPIADFFPNRTANDVAASWKYLLLLYTDQ